MYVTDNVYKENHTKLYNYAYLYDTMINIVRLHYFFLLYLIYIL